MAAKGSSSVFNLKNSVHLGGNDHLYHIGLLQTDDLETRFHDIKYVCMGGKADRMKEFAEYMYVKLGKPENCEFETVNGTKVLRDVGKSAGRYSFFKVGPVVSVSHGIGTASLSVVLHEVLKLLYYAKCKNDVEFFRVGTSGGLGLEPGTIVITKQSYDSQLFPLFSQVHCGEVVKLECRTDEKLRNALQDAANRAKVPVLIGNTMSTDDFFEGQARTDGAFCDYSEEDKINFLRKAHDEHGIKNIEMESLCFTAMCTRANVKCAVACVTVVNRLEHDDVTADGSLLQTWQENLYKMMAEYIEWHEKISTK
uniref:uridine phosphorylase 2-like n=1 Tax=Styela clava TaxID=7725 RepID=UPI00193ABEF2|nr:uridine phosphorylase 2-like [Styela clava]